MFKREEVDNSASKNAVRNVPHTYQPNINVGALGMNTEVTQIYQYMDTGSYFVVTEVFVPAEVVYDKKQMNEIYDIITSIEQK